MDLVRQWCYDEVQTELGGFPVWRCLRNGLKDGFESPLMLKIVYGLPIEELLEPLLVARIESTASRKVEVYNLMVEDVSLAPSPGWTSKSLECPPPWSQGQ